MSAALPRLTLTEAAVQTLRRRILAGDWPEGTPLRQEQLAAELGVSRVPLREALNRLEAEGLVQNLPHRGAVITPFSLDEVLELIELRALIESDLIARAVPRQTAQDHDTAQAVLDRFGQALQGEDVGQWDTLNAAFHLALYRPAGRPHSLALVDSLLARTGRYTRTQILVARYRERAHAEHTELLRLCREGRALKAASFVRQHIEAAVAALQASRSGAQTA
ncbi:GntR family transcriptional regulator [Amphibiibacter pelophylacis]|uniref:GntR family transcriptional regulator n=1 Tax=Amphibiibacter pelophylacis TaxID=1799477 RepID=A0ACC6P575_9BURK